jgi:hypothetical protein
VGAYPTVVTRDARILHWKNQEEKKMLLLDQKSRLEQKPKLDRVIPQRRARKQGLNR